MRLKLVSIAIPVILATGCVTAPVQLHDKAAPISEAAQLEAQNTLAVLSTKLTLKRKIAVGRLSNETTYGKSLLSDASNDKISDKISDMFVQGLTNSGNYLIFERPDIERLQGEANLTGIAQYGHDRKAL